MPTLNCKPWVTEANKTYYVDLSLSEYQIIPLYLLTTNSLIFNTYGADYCNETAATVTLLDMEGVETTEDINFQASGLSGAGIYGYSEKRTNIVRKVRYTSRSIVSEFKIIVLIGDQCLEPVNFFQKVTFNRLNETRS
jgi:hypothetical protein